MDISHFTGREQELRRLSRFGAAPDASERVFLIGGPPGVGKTRLLAEFRTRNSSRTIVTGLCAPYGSALLYPFRQLLTALSVTRPDVRAAHPRSFSVLDQLAAKRSPGDPTDPGDKLQLFEAFSEAFSALVHSENTTLVIEDIHWADSASLELIHYLLQTRRIKATIVATYRNDGLERDHPLRRFIASLSPLSSVAKLDLGPLDDVEIDDILSGLLGGTQVPKERRNDIRARAEGNPLFAEELARHVLEARDRDEDESLPISVEDAVLARLPSLTARERTIVSHASVLGRTFDAVLLADLTGTAFPDVLETLRRARDVSLIVEEEPPEFSFRHALMQEALYNDLLDAQRRDLHARAFAALKKRGETRGDAAELAYHAWAARDAEHCVVYAEQAGDDAMAARGPAEAATFYENAIASTTDVGTLVRLYEKLSTALVKTGFPERAIAPLELALRLHRDGGDRAGEAALALRLADALIFLGEDERALASVDRVTAALDGHSDPQLLAQARLLRARLALSDRDLKTALGHLGTVEEFLERLDNHTATLFHATRADARLSQRRYEAALADQEHAVELARAGPDPSAVAEQLATLGRMLLLAGRMDDAAATLREAWRAADQNFDASQATLCRIQYAEALLMVGKTEDAKSIVLDLLAVAVRTENPAFIVLLGRIGIFVSLRTHDEALGTRVLERLELEERFRFETPERLFPVSGAYAMILLDRGRVEEAKDVLRRAVTRLSKKRLRSTDWSICTLMTVAQHGSSEDLATARDVLAASVSALSSSFLSFFDAIAAARAHREEESKAFARAAAIGLRSFNFAYEEAIAWEMAGEKQLALDLYAAQGATRDARRIQRSMIAVNRRGRAGDELTTREREIATAIAAGETNRRIAERMCITEKTVETHVASIFNRLGVRSRGEVAARMSQPAESASETS